MVLPLTAAAKKATKRFDSEFYVEGYATTFNKPYLLYEFDGVQYFEVIDRNALVGADMSDVIMQYNHEGKVLARQSNKTLGIEADESGLFTFADLSKSRAAQDLYEEINNGLITKMSWAFKVLEDAYDRDTHKNHFEDQEGLRCFGGILPRKQRYRNIRAFFLRRSDRSREAGGVSAESTAIKTKNHVGGMTL